MERIYIMRNGVEYGPYDFAQVQQFIQNGQIGSGDQIRRENSSQWSSAGNFLKTVGLLGAGAVGGALLAGGMASAAQAAEVPDVSGVPNVSDGQQFTQSDYYDFNGDGVADLELHDFNGDGIADVQIYDFNGDGLADIAEIDIDGDGVVDAIIGFFDGLSGLMG